MNQQRRYPLSLHLLNHEYVQAGASFIAIWSDGCLTKRSRIVWDGKG